MIIGWQFQHAVTQRGIKILKILDRFSRRSSVGLGENSVESNCVAMQLNQSGDEVSYEGSRPGPLAIGFEACFIDVDDNHRSKFIRSRQNGLEEVKAPKPELLD